MKEIHDEDHNMIMPDGRPLSAWWSEIEMWRSQATQLKDAQREQAIFMTLCGLVYEHWRDNGNLDWHFRLKAADVMTSTDFYSALRNFLKIEGVKENEYQCSACKNVYEKSWSDEEADKESLEIHGVTRHNSDMAVVCDDCFNKMRKQGLF